VITPPSGDTSSGKSNQSNIEKQLHTTVPPARKRRFKTLRIKVLLEDSSLNNVGKKPAEKARVVGFVAAVGRHHNVELSVGLQMRKFSAVTVAVGRCILPSVPSLLAVAAAVPAPLSPPL
jgi:hypothetical protein